MEQNQAHVVILPFPLPGHVKPVLHLAELLCYAGLHITFVNSDYNQRCLRKVVDILTFRSHFSSFEFESISDGLPLKQPRDGPSLSQVFFNTTMVMKPLFHKLLITLDNSKQRPPPTCVVADGIMCFAIEVAEELGIPTFTFSTHSPCGLWAIMNAPKLMESAKIPLRGDKDMDEAITCIPGMEGLLRCRDLPSHCKEELYSPIMEFVTSEAKAMTRASALVLNVFEELNGAIIPSLKSVFPRVYCIGPLHALLKSRMKDYTLSVSSKGGALKKEDRSCMVWLDQQRLRSVVYVSLGSLIDLSQTQLLELWFGLVNSGKRFLWVIRPDLVDKGGSLGQIPSELQEATKERGFMVGWAPQENVLSHPAVGGFLTHGGWNSTLESIYAGVPMICWPFLADQQVNSRCVSHLLRIGLDMKDTCDREIIEKMVKDVMEEKREALMRSMDEIARMANVSIQKGGSSHCNLDMLIDDLCTLGSNLTDKRSM